MSKIDLDQFVTDMCDAIGGMGIWPAFLRKMAEVGYTEAQIDDAFEKLKERH